MRGRNVMVRKEEKGKKDIYEKREWMDEKTEVNGKKRGRKKSI